MAATHNLLLPFKRTRRVAGLVSFLLFAGIGGSLLGLLKYDLPFVFVATVLGVLLLAALALEAVPLMKPAIASGDGLTLDRKGLAFTRKGRTVRWRWDEISNIRLRNALHPVGLLLGHFVTFGVPADQRRAVFGFASDRLVRRGSAIVVGNDYASPIYDIFVQMAFFRDVAAGAESPLGGPMEVRDARAPEPHWTFRKDRGQLRLWHIIGLMLGPAAGMAVVSLAIGEFPGSIDDLLPLLDSAFAFLAGALIGAPWLILLALKRNAAQDNMLTLTAGGIGISNNVECKHWLWWEISDIRVTRSTGRGKDGAVARIVSFRAMQDGALPGKVMMEGKAAVPVSCAIEDDYEMSVDEIARQMNAWRDWYNKAFGHPDEDAKIGRLLEEHVGPQPEGISFLRKKGENQPASLVEEPISWLAMAPMAALAGLMIWMLRAEIEIGLPTWVSFPWWVKYSSLLLLGLGPVIAVQVLLSVGKNRIEMDDNYLNLVRLGRTSRWLWSEIGPAEMRRLRTKWSAKQRAVLTVEAPANGIGSAFLRWALNIDNRRLAVIEDIYDTPLDEIAETLNARGRKQGGRVTRQPAV